jgi:hypothetical protein
MLQDLEEGHDVVGVIARDIGKVSRNVKLEAPRRVGSRRGGHVDASHTPSRSARFVKKESMCTSDVEKTTRWCDPPAFQHREAQPGVLPMEALVGDIVVVATGQPTREVRIIEYGSGFVLEWQGVDVRDPASTTLDVTRATNLEEVPTISAPAC